MARLLSAAAGVVDVLGAASPPRSAFNIAAKASASEFFGAAAGSKAGVAT